MMATTHALVGFALGALATALGVPAGPALLAAVAGSVLPDFDLYAGHRRTLHFPVLYPIAAAAGVVVALATGGWLPATLAALLLLGAALHTTADVFGGGLELRPWEGTSDRAVYDHVRGRWIAPRRWVRYDGAPEDLLLAGGLAAVAYPFTASVPLAEWAILALLGVSAVYVLLRRVLARLAAQIAGTLPPRVREQLPPRYVEGAGSSAGAGSLSQRR